MTAKLRLAGLDDHAKLDRLMAACHDEVGVKLGDEARTEVLVALLSGDVPGAAYLIGPPSSPVGYILLRFGFCVQAGGMIADIDEIFIRPPVRGRAMASEAVRSVARTLRGHEICTLRASLAKNAPEALFHRLLFKSVQQTRMQLVL